MIIKRWNGSAFVEEYPKTTVGKIVASGTPGSTNWLRGDATWNAPTRQDIVPDSPIQKTTGDTFALTEKEDFIYMNSSSAQTLTIPPNTSVAFPTGTEIHIARWGSGDVTISPGSGVTLYSEGSKRKINAQYQVVTIKKISTDYWILFGALKT